MALVHKLFDTPSYVTRTKALISSMVTTQLICVFVSTTSYMRFSHNAVNFQEHPYLVLDLAMQDL